MTDGRTRSVNFYNRPDHGVAVGRYVDHSRCLSAITITSRNHGSRSPGVTLVIIDARTW